jgi:hypothetical protein
VQDWPASLLGTRDRGIHGLNCRELASVETLGDQELTIPENSWNPLKGIRRTAITPVFKND